MTRAVIIISACCIALGSWAFAPSSHAMTPDRARPPVEKPLTITVKGGFAGVTDDGRMPTVEDCFARPHEPQPGSLVRVYNGRHYRLGRGLLQWKTVGEPYQEGIYWSIDCVLVTTISVRKSWFYDVRVGDPYVPIVEDVFDYNDVVAKKWRVTLVVGEYY